MTKAGTHCLCSLSPGNYSSSCWSSQCTLGFQKKDRKKFVPLIHWETLSSSSSSSSFSLWLCVCRLSHFILPFSVSPFFGKWMSDRASEQVYAICMLITVDAGAGSLAPAPASALWCWSHGHTAEYFCFLLFFLFFFFFFFFGGAMRRSLCEAAKMLKPLWRQAGSLLLLLMKMMTVHMTFSLDSLFLLLWRQIDVGCERWRRRRRRSAWSVGTHTQSHNLTRASSVKLLFIRISSFLLLLLFLLLPCVIDGQTAATGEGDIDSTAHTHTHTHTLQNENEKNEGGGGIRLQCTGWLLPLCWQLRHPLNFSSATEECP